MRQEATHVLRKAIVDGIYDPGEQIYEADLAQQLEVSRGPIREALLQLEKESLVKSAYNKGWFVLKLTPEEMTEITNLRALLEVVALSLAQKHINRRELSQLKKIESGLLETFERGDTADAIQGDFDFHKKIWKISQHRALEETLIDITTPYFAFLKMSRIRDSLERKAIRQGLQNHRAMVDLLSGESTHSAEWCIRNHFSPTLIKDWNLLLDELFVQHRQSKVLRVHDRDFSAPPPANVPQDDKKVVVID